MKKISIKLGYDVTQLICDLYDEDLERKKRIIHNSNEDYKEFQAIADLMESFINKMKKKLIDKKGEKSFKMSFRYYEAYFLAYYANNSLEQFDKTSYERSILLNLFLNIDKKL